MADSRSGPRVLVVGESWVKHTVHMKGFDHFHSTEYEEGGTKFLQALEQGGCAVDYVRAHEISTRFPTDRDALSRYEVVVLSDVGANSFLLCDETFLRSEISVNRLDLICDYVRDGGGLLMIGGYLSFAGIDGRARYGMSPLAHILPVELLAHDDRVEVPQGIRPEVVDPDHAVLGGVSESWPRLLGYNRLLTRPESTVVVRHGEDPLLVTGRAGRGRTVAFASDCAPHWAPPEFVSWSRYASLWSSIVRWAAAGERDAVASNGAVSEVNV